MISKYRLIIITVRNRLKITLPLIKFSIVRLLIYKQPALELDKASESASQDSINSNQDTIKITSSMRDEI